MGKALATRDRGLERIGDCRLAPKHTEASARGTMIDAVVPREGVPVSNELNDPEIMGNKYDRLREARCITIP